MPEMPVVVVPVCADDVALDACLAALDRGTPAGTRVWLADDAQSGPRGYAVIERWMARTALAADYTRRQVSVGEVVHLDQILAACAGLDVAVLAADAAPLPGWLGRMRACLSADGAIATATPWSNAGEAATWPSLGETRPPPPDLSRLARAVSRMPAAYPELPGAIDHAVLVRASARDRAGGLDAAGYSCWSAALTDLSLRLSGLGWRNVLCDDAFVARTRESAPGDGDMEHLSARWPGWNARVARFVMEDPLRDARRRLTDLFEAARDTSPQADLFALTQAAPELIADE